VIGHARSGIRRDNQPACTGAVWDPKDMKCILKNRTLSETYNTYGDALIQNG
jgi:hypothetical protein